MKFSTFILIPLTISLSKYLKCPLLRSAMSRRIMVPEQDISHTSPSS